MILRCEFSTTRDTTGIVSTSNVEVDDCDADSIIADPHTLDGEKLFCISAVPVSQFNDSYTR